MKFVRSSKHKKDIRTTPLTPFWYILVYTDFTHCSRVFIAHFEHVFIVHFEQVKNGKIKHEISVPDWRDANPSMFWKRLFLKFCKINRKTPVTESFSVKLQAKILQHRCSSEVSENFWSICFYRTHPGDYFCWSTTFSHWQSFILPNLPQMLFFTKTKVESNIFLRFKAMSFHEISCHRFQQNQNV